MSPKDDILSNNKQNAFNPRLLSSSHQEGKMIVDQLVPRACQQSPHFTFKDQKKTQGRRVHLNGV